MKSSGKNNNSQMNLRLTWKRLIKLQKKSRLSRVE